MAAREPWNLKSGSAALVKNGKTILSGIDPAGRAEKVVDSISIRARTLYFCPSVLFGYGLSRLLSRLEGVSSSAVLCVESDPEMFELSKKNIDPSITDNIKLHITDVCNADMLADVVRDKWGARAFRRIEAVRLTGGWQLSPDLYDSLYDSLRRGIAADWSNALTLTKLGRLYIRNALRNLAGLSRFFPLSDLSFGAANVLVLGAGPSLDETLDALLRHFPGMSGSDERPFRIVCVDTCLGALKERGITPDLAVILESQHWNLPDFFGCKGWKVKAAADLSCFPASARTLGGAGYLFMTPWTTLNIFNRLREKGFLLVIVQPLGSVGLTALDIARRISQGCVICAGLDFSFTADKYHCKGAPGHLSRLNRQSRFRGILSTEAYNSHSFSASSKSGIPVYSSPVMRHYLDIFKQEFQSDPRLYDIEGTGLSLGLKTLTMSEAMSVLRKNDARATGNDKQPENERNRFSRGGKNELASFYKEEISRLVKLRDMLTGGIDADEFGLSLLVDECDYLWAHFPDYTGGRPSDLSDVSFLKRIRAEIDPMIRLLENSLKTAEDRQYDQN